MSQTPTVSVIIPAYGHADVIGRTLVSALSQELPGDLEVIVINDGATDGTAEVVKPYLPSITYVEQANAGQATARNHGLSLARGEFVAMLDDDDLWPAGKLAWQVEALRAEPDAVLVYGEDARIGPDDEPLDNPPRPEYQRPHGESTRNGFLTGCYIGTPGQTLIRRDALRAVGGFDTDIFASDDWDLYMRLADAGPFLYEDRVAIFYRVHPGNTSSTSVLRHWQGHKKAADKHPIADPILAARRAANERRYFLRPLLRLSHAARQRGDLATSLAAQQAAAEVDGGVRWKKEWWWPHLLNRLGRGRAA